MSKSRLGATSPNLRKALASSLHLGLRFLGKAVAPDGAWPSRGSYGSGRPPVPESVPFTAARGIFALDACDDPCSVALRLRSRAFLHSRIEYPGVWRYLPRFYPDLDDTSLCSLAAGPHIWLLTARNIGPMLSYRDSEGRFLTWMAPSDGKSPNVVDSVVNANVVAYLGDRAETRAAQAWLERLVEKRGESGSAPYYVSTMDLYEAMARASSIAPPVFAGIRGVLADRIVELLDSCGEPEDAMRIAQGVTALDYLGAHAVEETARRALELLVEAQCASGAWRECVVWRGQPGTHGRFWSEALPAACCVGAIARALRG